MSLQKSKILIIDDEKVILKMLQRKLNRIGIASVDVAESAEEGIKKINSNQYDLILTDIKMPGMSGNDVLNHVRTKVEKSTVVIAMSGTPWLTEKSDFDAVLTKPFNKEELLGVVSQFVQNLAIV